MKKKLTSLVTIFLLILISCTGCGQKISAVGGAPEIGGLKYESTDQLEYANQFDIYRYEGGYAYIDIHQSEKLLVVPEGKPVPESLPEGTVVIEHPLDNIYLCATSAMALFDSIGGVENIKFVGTKANGWYIQSAVDAINSGSMEFAGKYSAPDYEMLLNNNVQLAIESTMIYHTPEVKEKLEELGIKVMVEMSSYETHPLGRTEWVKFYGALLGKDKEAAEAFDVQMEAVRRAEGNKPTEQTVAFFTINSSGKVVTYKTQGYVPEMIRIAGGIYLPEELGGDDNALSTVNMSMEEYYVTAKEADVIIYNMGSFGSPVYSMEQLLEKSPVLEDFAAVKSGNVWCTSRSMFQETDKMGTMIGEINDILSEEDPDESEFNHFFKLE